MSQTTGTTALRLQHLPDEVLLGLFQHLPFRESVVTLPLVCRSFAQLLRLPTPRVGDEEFSLMIARLRAVDGRAICNWLLPRLTQRLSFHFPVDALRLQAEECFVPELLKLLPGSLRILSLRSNWSDMHYRHQPPACPAYQPCQDMAPHLSALASLSQLQQLAVPIHTAIDSPGLAALSHLQHLHLEFRRRTFPDDLDPLHLDQQDNHHFPMR